jgi:membrane protein YqaA with SNARE-associated domain
MSDGQRQEGVAAALAKPAGAFGLLRRLYDWVLHWAETPYGAWALGVIAFAEASFFPVPPDVLLMALCLGAPKRGWFFAAICSVASVSGGVFGYLIGWIIWEEVSGLFFSYAFSREVFDRVALLYQENAFWAVFAAGLTPIPYKVFTIAAGVFEINFGEFLLASILSRTGRFFAIAGLIWIFGPPIRGFIDKYFNLLSVAFVVLLVGGFVLVRWLL